MGTSTPCPAHGTASSIDYKAKQSACLCAQLTLHYTHSYARLHTAQLHPRAFPLKHSALNLPHPSHEAHLHPPGGCQCAGQPHHCSRCQRQHPFLRCELFVYFPPCRGVVPLLTLDFQQPCLNQFTSNGGSTIAGCNRIDAACICSNKDFLSGIACCLVDKCNAEDQQAATDYALAFCKANQVTGLPTAVSCASTATASTGTPTSTGSAAATITNNGSSTTSGTSIDANAASTTSSGTTSTPTNAAPTNAARVGAGIMGGLAAFVALL